MVPSPSKSKTDIENTVWTLHVAATHVLEAILQKAHRPPQLLGEVTDQHTVLQPAL